MHKCQIYNKYLILLCPGCVFIQSREVNLTVPLNVLYGLTDPGLVFEKYVNGTADYFCIRRGASRVVGS